MAIAVTGGGVYSFGTATPLGSSVSQYVNSQAGVRSQTIYTIKTTLEQDAQMLRYLRSQSDNIGIIDNCAVRTCQALNAGGILNNLATAITPSAVEFQLLISGAQFSVANISQNMSASTSLTNQFESTGGSGNANAAGQSQSGHTDVGATTGQDK